MKTSFWVAGVVFAGIVSGVSADEVLFKSGDRLTGKVKSVDAGKMVFASKVAGLVTLKMDDIQTFSTEVPVSVSLADGTTYQRRVAGADEGHVTLAAEESGQDVPLALGEMAKVRTGRARWKGAVTVGTTLVRGNTDSSSVNASAEASRRTDRDRITLGAGYLYGEQRNNSTGHDSLTADNWFLKGQYDYFVTERFFGYGSLRYEKDRVASLDARVTPSVGCGYQWIERADLNFDTEIGGSWVSERYTDPEETRTYMAGRAAYHLDKAFNGHVKGFHNMEVIPSVERFDTYLLNTDVGLRASLTATLILEAKAQMAYNSQPAEDRENKDLRYTLGVGWTF